MAGGYGFDSGFSSGFNIDQGATRPPAQDVMQMISNAGHGTIGASSGWSILGGRMTESPNTQIGLYDTGGFSPNPKWALDQPTVQVRVRGNVMDYLGAYAKALNIKNTLLGAATQTISGTIYKGILMEGDIIFAENDHKERPVFTLNFSLWREHANSVVSNRPSPSGQP